MRYVYTIQSNTNLTDCGLSLKNCMVFYSIAQALEDKRTAFKIQEFVIGQDIPPAQIIDLTLDAVKMDIPQVAKYLSAVISEKFSQLMKSTGDVFGDFAKENQAKLCQFDLPTFKQIIIDDNLTCGDEDTAFTAAIEYIKGRQQCPARGSVLPGGGAVGVVGGEGKAEVLGGEVKPGEEKTDAVEKVGGEGEKVEEKPGEEQPAPPAEGAEVKPEEGAP